MANFRDIMGASKNLNRVTDINLEPENRAALEAVMVALAAGGRVQEMSIIAQTLEKTSVQTDIVGAIRDLKSVIEGIRQPEVTSVIAEPNDELARLRAENAALKSSIPI
jgi:hypothetical protein